MGGRSPGGAGSYRQAWRRGLCVPRSDANPAFSALGRTADRRQVHSTLSASRQATTTLRFDYDPGTTAAHYQLVEHYDALRVKYEPAAACPWWFVEPDLPEPAWPKRVR